MNPDSRHPLLYVLHSGKLYGTERMALATLAGLCDEFRPMLAAPPGQALEEAAKSVMSPFPFTSKWDLAGIFRKVFRENRSLTILTTSVKQSMIAAAVNVFYRRRMNHLHIVHGGVEDAGSYGNKKWLNVAGVNFLTVSDFARQKLIDHGVPARRIEVVNNFLLPQRIQSAPRRRPYDGSPLKNVLIVSRMEKLKRVDLLLDALDQSEGKLADISFKILGLGTEMKSLQARAAGKYPNVNFAGYSGNVADELAGADLLLHTCPVEPFGLVILEAMAANVAVLAPDKGGAASLIDEGTSGFKFRADDAGNLAESLIELKNAPAETLNQAVAGGRIAVEQTYSAKAALAKYRQLLRPRGD
jgi:glycosyltransferase involved in cell wall biosynthesis